MKKYQRPVRVGHRLLMLAAVALPLSLAPGWTVHAETTPPGGSIFSRYFWSPEQGIAMLRAQFLPAASKAAETPQAADEVKAKAAVKSDELSATSSTAALKLATAAPVADEPQSDAKAIEAEKPDQARKADQAAEAPVPAAPAATPEPTAKAERVAAAETAVETNSGTGAEMQPATPAAAASAKDAATEADQPAAEATMAEKPAVDVMAEAAEPAEASEPEETAVEAQAAATAAAGTTRARVPGTEVDGLKIAQAAPPRPQGTPAGQWVAVKDRWVYLPQGPGGQAEYSAEGLETLAAAAPPAGGWTQQDGAWVYVAPAVPAPQAAPAEQAAPTAEVAPSAQAAPVPQAAGPSGAEQTAPAEKPASASSAAMGRWVQRNGEWVREAAKTPTVKTPAATEAGHDVTTQPAAKPATSPAKPEVSTAQEAPAAAPAPAASAAAGSSAAAVPTSSESKRWVNRNGQWVREIAVAAPSEQSAPAAVAADQKAEAPKTQTAPTKQPSAAPAVKKDVAGKAAADRWVNRNGQWVREGGEPQAAKPAAAAAKTSSSPPQVSAPTAPLGAKPAAQPAAAPAPQATAKPALPGIAVVGKNEVAAAKAPAASAPNQAEPAAGVPRAGRWVQRNGQWAFEPMRSGGNSAVETAPQKAQQPPAATTPEIMFFVPGKVPGTGDWYSGPASLLDGARKLDPSGDAGPR